MPLLRFAILFGMFGWVTAAPEAKACGCGDNRSWAAVDSSDVLFAGRLVEAELAYLIDGVPWLDVPERLLPGLRPNYVSMVFEVERWWRGSGRRRVEVFTDRSSCALQTPELGEDMLIEAIKYRGAVFTHLCLRSVPLYSGGEVEVLAARPNYEGYRLLTRDSLRVHLGPGFEPSGVGRLWYMLAAVVAVAGIVVLWRRRAKAA